MTAAGRTSGAREADGGAYSRGDVVSLPGRRDGLHEFGETLIEKSRSRLLGRPARRFAGRRRPPARASLQVAARLPSALSRGGGATCGVIAGSTPGSSAGDTLSAGGRNRGGRAGPVGAVRRARSPSSSATTSRSTRSGRLEVLWRKLAAPFVAVGLLFLEVRRRSSQRSSSSSSSRPPARWRSRSRPTRCSGLEVRRWRSSC